jgi:hypothetical protein
MRKTGGAGGGAGSAFELMAAEALTVSNEAVNGRGTSSEPLSGEGAALAAAAGGASSPQSQSDEPSDASGTSLVVPQHECGSAFASRTSLIGHGAPSPHRPHGPAVGAASANPGRSSAMTIAVRR